MTIPTIENATGLCAACGKPMPKGEEMFKFHGYSGPCRDTPPADHNAGANQSVGVLANKMAIPSTSDARTVNNVMRHEYKVLTAEEKVAMQKIKDDGLALHTYFESLGSSRELSVAKTKIEEAVMWAVKHITR